MSVHRSLDRWESSSIPHRWSPVFVPGHRRTQLVINHHFSTALFSSQLSFVNSQNVKIPEGWWGLVALQTPDVLMLVRCRAATADDGLHGRQPAEGGSRGGQRFAPWQEHRRAARDQAEEADRAAGRPLAGRQPLADRPRQGLADEHGAHRLQAVEGRDHNVPSFTTASAPGWVSPWTSIYPAGTAVMLPHAWGSSRPPGLVCGAA